MSYENYRKWKEISSTVNPVVSVVIPAYNEAQRIVPTIGAIAGHLSKRDMPWELIVADDGSTDDTVAILQALNLANMKILIAEKNGGKGHAVQRGMLAARGRYILFTDADNSTPIENIDYLLDKLFHEGYTVAVGSRSAQGASTQNKSILRKAMSNGLRYLVQTTLGIKVNDTQCGFKMYARETAQRLHQLQTITGFSFDLEILYLATKSGDRIAEVPVEWFDAPGSKVNVRKEAQRFVKDIFRIRWQSVRGIYGKETHYAYRNRYSLSAK